MTIYGSKSFAKRMAVFTVAIFLLQGHVSRRYGQAAVSGSEGLALGRAYAKTLAKTYADGWVAAARALDEGKSVAEAQKSLQTTWQTARLQSFRSDIQPAFSNVLAEGTEPADSAKRKEVAALWRMFARGLRHDQ